jgi:hypothetical protein
VLATIAFGMVAAIRGRSSAALAASSQAARPHLPKDRRRHSWAVEIALGLALSLMAMLMARSFIALRAVDLGFTRGRGRRARRPPGRPLSIGASQRVLYRVAGAGPRAAALNPRA